MRMSDWSSDVCSSDLAHLLDIGRRRPRPRPAVVPRPHPGARLDHLAAIGDRKSVVSGTSVSVRVDLGGRRIINNKRNHTPKDHTDTTRRLHHTQHTTQHNPHTLQPHNTRNTKT